MYVIQSERPNWTFLDNYVHFGQLRSLWTTTFTLDKYVHFGRLRSLWTSTFTLDKYVHFGKERSLWTSTLTLDNYVWFGQHVYFGQLRSPWTTMFKVPSLKCNQFCVAELWRHIRRKSAIKWRTFSLTCSTSPIIMKFYQ